VATLLAAVGLALTFFVGPTMASFADREYARDNLATGTHNILIRTDGSFCNTSADGTPDNKPETANCGSLAPLEFPTPATPLVAGDAGTNVTFTFRIQVDLDAQSGLRTNLSLRLQQGTGASNDSEGKLAAALRFDVAVARSTQYPTFSAPVTIATGLSLADLAAGLPLNGPGRTEAGLTTSAANGTYYEVTLTAFIPDQGTRLDNAALAGRTYNLMVVTTATACTEGRDGCVTS
jgi:hypothetical protein